MAIIFLQMWKLNNLSKIMLLTNMKIKVRHDVFFCPTNLCCLCNNFYPAKIACLQLDKQDEVATGKVVLWSHNSIWKTVGTWQARKKYCCPNSYAKFPMAIEEPVKLIISKGFSGGASGKESTCQCRRCQGHRFDPWVRKIPGEGNGNSLQYSCLENQMDRRAWWATVHGVAKSRT